MMRTIAWALGALFLAGVVHIVTVLGVPRFAVNDPWREIGEIAGDGVFSRLPRPAPGVKTLPGLDPAMTHAACRFSLDKGPMRIRAETTDGYWSLSLYDRRGLWVWGVDNRASEQKPIDILVADHVQVAQLRESLPEEFDDVVIVDWSGREGFAIYKVLVPIRSREAEIDAALATAKCTPTPLS
ncbi:MAG: DUF1254 domain-containing protein [Siculibacillus sp.]|nr:DUF1254 domain-containing protein [Siculibacillus sp.]